MIENNELEAYLKDFEEKRTEARLELCKRLAKHACTRNELEGYIFELMKPMMGKTWKLYQDKDGHKSLDSCIKDLYCIYSHHIKNGFASFFTSSLNEVAEELTVPLGDIKLYRLKKDWKDIVLKTPALEMYERSPKLFKVYFEIISDVEREGIISKLYQSREDKTIEVNEDVERWISENYGSLTRKVGMDRVASKHETGELTGK